MDGFLISQWLLGGLVGVLALLPVYMQHKGYKMNRYEQLCYFIAKTVYAEFTARSADELEDVSILDLRDLIQLGRVAYQERQEFYAERDELLYGAKRKA